MGKTTAWRLPPCPPYDVEGMESWLADMAAEGWMLDKDGFFLGLACFVRGEPCVMRYRLEASLRKVGGWSADGGIPDRAAQELNEDCGWEYVDRRGQFFIYRSGDPRAVELQTDPRVQALAVRAVEKRRRRDLLVLLACWLVFGLLYYVRGASLLLLAVYAGLPLVLLFLLLLLICLLILFGELRYLRRLKRKLRGGTPPDHARDWRKSRKGYFGLRALLILSFALYFVLILRGLNTELLHEDRIPLSAYGGEPPFATMADFAEGEYRETWADIRFDYVSEWANALLRTGMKWGEHAEVRRPDGSSLDGGLYVDYFAARSEWLAKAVAAELRRVDRARARKNYEVLELPELGLDDAAAYRNLIHFPTVVLRRGSTVLRATFYQTGEGEPLPLEEWAGILAASLP